MSSRIGNARSGALNRFREDLAIPEVGRYTQGPLDATFGAHPVLPTGGDDEVLRYLQAVRHEALADEAVSFASRDREVLEALRVMQRVPVNEAFREWAALAVEQLMATKIAMRNHQATDTEASGIPSTSSAWRELVMGTEPPQYEFFAALSHPTVIKLIVYTTKWLSASTSQNLSLWIFTLLVRLEAPLDHTETAIMRELAKKAIRICSKGTHLDGITRYTTGLVVAVVGLYFGQADLLGDYSDTLSTDPERTQD